MYSENSGSLCARLGGEPSASENVVWLPSNTHDCHALLSRYNEVRISEKYWRLLNSATQAALAVLTETMQPAESAKLEDVRGTTDLLENRFVDPMTGVQRMYSTCCHLIADPTASPRPNVVCRKSAAAALFSRARLNVAELTDTSQYNAMIERIPRAAAAAAAALTHGGDDRAPGVSEQKTLRELFCLVRCRCSACTHGVKFILSSCE